LSAANCNRLLQRFKCPDHSFDVGLTPQALTFIGELAEGPMSALVIAALACGNFIFNPTRAAFYSRN
jgi:hypothetical protein